MLRRLFIVFILISTFAVAGCKISGTITDENEVGVGGVIVYLYGEGEVEGGSIMAITDADGNYVFEGFHHGKLIIKPDPGKEDYTFNPPFIEMTVGLFQNVLDADFTAVAKREPDTPPEISLQPWSTYQGNAAHTGYVPVILDTDNFAVAWTWPDEEAELVPLNPVAAGDGKVFVTTGGDYGPHLLTVLNSADGTPLWTKNSDDIYSGDIDFINPPAYANGTVYIQSGGYEGSFLWMFNANSGEVLVNPAPYDNQGARNYAPTIYFYDDINDGVYAAGGYYDVDNYYFGGVYGFNGVTGQGLWGLPLTPYEQWTPAVNENYVMAYTGWYTRYISPDLVRTESLLTVIHRIDSPGGTAGEVAFTISDPDFVQNPDDQWSMHLAPVLGGANNVIVINGGRLINFDLAGQTIGWQIPQDENDQGDEEEKGGKQFSGQPSLANGFIYAVYKGYLHARSENDGSFIWEWQPPLETPSEPQSGESIVTPMIVTDNLIFVSTESTASTESTTYAVDLESQTAVWSYPAGGHLALSDDGILLIVTSEGILHAISTLE